MQSRPYNIRIISKIKIFFEIFQVYRTLKESISLRLWKTWNLNIIWITWQPENAKLQEKQ